MLGILSGLVSLAMLMLVGRVVALAGSGFESRVGMSYTWYAVSGALVHGLGMSALGAFRRVVRREQLQGTLEQLLASGRSPVVVVVLAGSAELVLQAVAFVSAGFVASWVTGTALPAPAALGVAGLYACGMAGLGLASAGVTIVCKEGEPIAWVFGMLSGALGGVCFPSFLLPAWLAAAARLLPTTHALALVRASLGGAPLPKLPLVALAAFGAIAAVSGVVVLRWGLSKARCAGTLARY